MSGVFAFVRDNVGLLCVIALLVPAVTALWYGWRSWHRRQRLSLRVSGLALLVFGLATGLVVAVQMSSSALTLLFQLIRVLSIVVAVAAAWIYGSDRLSLAPRFRPIRRWLLPMGFVLLCVSAWVLVDAHASNTVAVAWQSAARAEQSTAPETDGAVGGPELSDNPGADRVQAAPQAWEQVSSERLRVGLPVFLGVFLALAVLVTVAAIWS